MKIMQPTTLFAMKIELQSILRIFSSASGIHCHSHPSCYPLLLASLKRYHSQKPTPPKPFSRFPVVKGITP